VTAQEVAASEVDGPTTTLDDAPEVRAALFDEGYCETDANDRRECHLELRVSDREGAVVRALARHGVRCPYRNGAGAHRYTVKRNRPRCAGVDRGV